MSKNSMFAAAVILLVGMASTQAVLIGGVSSEPMMLGQSVPASDQTAHTLPVEAYKHRT